MTQYTYSDHRGNVYRGIITAYSHSGGVWFLPLCADGITWMRDPVWVPANWLDPVSCLQSQPEEVRS